MRAREWGISTALNELCQLASMTLGTPIAFVSLIYETKQYFCGMAGLDGCQTSRESAFCAHTIMSLAPLVVVDAEKDSRFCSNPLVTGYPGIKAYLGVPLQTESGVCIGAMCIVDTQPRSFDASDIAALTFLSRIALSIIDGHRMSLELDEQLKAAIALQQEMLPSAERIAQIESGFPLDVASFFRALEGIGGDIWNIEAASEHRVMMYVADFTGHGVGAALNAARFHSFMHILCKKTDDPALLLTKLNKRLSEVLPEGQFATMFCATIDFKAHTIEYASAGAPPMLYRGSAHDPFELLCQPSFPLGIIPQANYERHSAPFREGGVLVLYTDGLTEMPRPPHSIFTAESLREHLDEGKGKASLSTVKSVVSRLFQRPELEVHDDITLIVARHTGGAFTPCVDYGF